MNNLQIKCLKHIIQTLETYDTYPTYSALSGSMAKNSIDNKTATVILNTHQDSIRIQSKKVDDVKSWINALISDFDSQQRELP